MIGLVPITDGIPGQVPFRPSAGARPGCGDRLREAPARPLPWALLTPKRGRIDHMDVADHAVVGCCSQGGGAGAIEHHRGRRAAAVELDFERLDGRERIHVVPDGVEVRESARQSRFESRPVGANCLSRCAISTVTPDVVVGVPLTNTATAALASGRPAPSVTVSDTGCSHRQGQAADSVSTPAGA